VGLERDGSRAERRGTVRMNGATDWGQLALDIHLAAQTRAPVLISAPADCAENVARAIAALSSARKGADLVICDCAGGDSPAQAVARARAARGAAADQITLLLREVHALGEADQAEVARVVGARGKARWTNAPRIISTTSVSLFDRVRNGAFDKRLFYCLNVLHIVVKGKEDADAT
jgi:DNA-binding NtrC family response regulator